MKSGIPNMTPGKTRPIPQSAPNRQRGPAGRVWPHLQTSMRVRPGLHLNRGLERRPDWQELGLIAGAALILIVLWSTPLAFPLRFFSVLVHECSHAIAGILTGGSVDRIILHAESGGLTYIHGGMPLIYGSAGYLGSIFFGGLFLYLSRMRSHAGSFCLVAGLLLMGMTLAFVNPLSDSFGFFYGSIAGLAIGVVGWKFPRVAPFFMKFLGVAVLLFGFMDIQSTLFGGPQALLHSDAGILSRQTGIPALFWALSWLCISLAVFGFFTYLAATSPRWPLRDRMTPRA